MLATLFKRGLTRGNSLRGGLFITFFLFSLFLSRNGLSQGLDECLLQAIKNGDESQTIGQLRQQCQQMIREEKLAVRSTEEPQGVVEDRMHQEERGPFTLMAHKPNYMLVGAYNASGYDSEPFQKQFDDPSISQGDTEAQFQFSVKCPLVVNLFNGNMDIYAAYTNRSFWQIYNSDSTSPLRETDHEPEAWVQFHPTWKVFGFSNTWNTFGVVHQSNGRNGEISRSWNRLYATFIVERGNLELSLKPWYRITDGEEDDNPDITDYLGHSEVLAAYRWKKHVFSIMSRNNLESGFSKGTVELSWSFPLWNYKYLKGYVQYFNGYGESLIDYNHHVNRIGAGFSLTDWL